MQHTLPTHLPYLTLPVLEQFIDTALAEDMGSGDHSSNGSVPAETTGRARLLVKGNGIIAGVALARIIFKRIDAALEVELLKADGSKVAKGDVVLTVSGSTRSILLAERLVLNTMQRMSGIATHTAELVNLLEGTQTRVIDTRKTTPNFRVCEKWAVVIGGGVNHRFGLYDMVMLKDNHVDFAGGIRPAVENTLKYLESNGLTLKIEVETRNLQEVQEALATPGVNRIMLDNMDIITTAAAVSLINGRVETEASGNITRETIRHVAETGVNYISVGALTHSSPIMDLSLKAF